METDTQYLLTSHHTDFYSHYHSPSPDTGERHQMLEVCSPIVSSTSHPELKIAMNPNLGQVRDGGGGGYQGNVRQQDNIGSIITMLIDDQGADIDELLIENRDHRASDGRERLEVQLGTDIKEENCLSDQMQGMEYPRPYPSPDYTFYQRDYVSQDGPDKDLETRSSLSSNSDTGPGEAGEEGELNRYSLRSGYTSVLNQGQGVSVASSPYLVTRDTEMSGTKKDDKYWERRRKNNLAAKKSRDARRVRENQLRLRVLCLENANRVLREQMDRKEVELAQLRERVSKYEGSSTTGPSSSRGNI